MCILITVFTALQSGTRILRSSAPVFCTSLRGLRLPRIRSISRPVKFVIVRNNKSWIPVLQCSDVTHAATVLLRILAAARRGGGKSESASEQKLGNLILHGGAGKGGRLGLQQTVLRRKGFHSLTGSWPSNHHALAIDCTLTRSLCLRCLAATEADNYPSARQVTRFSEQRSCNHQLPRPIPVCCYFVCFSRS